MTYPVPKNKLFCLVFALQRSCFVPAFNPELIREFEDMEENLKTKREQMIDTRGTARFFNITSELSPGMKEKQPKTKPLYMW